MPVWVSTKRFAEVPFSDTRESITDLRGNFRNDGKLAPLSHAPSHGSIMVSNSSGCHYPCLLAFTTTMPGPGSGTVEDIVQQGQRQAAVGGKRSFSAREGHREVPRGLTKPLSISEDLLTPWKERNCVVVRLLLCPLPHGSEALRVKNGFMLYGGELEFLDSAGSVGNITAGSRRLLSSTLCVQSCFFCICCRLGAHLAVHRSVYARQRSFYQGGLHR